MSTQWGGVRKLNASVVLAALLLVTNGAAAVSAAPPAAIFFSETFDSGLPSANLAGYEHFTLENGAIRRNGVFSNGNDRRYMRTTATNYNEVDFRYELTFTTSITPGDSLNYMGIGSGERRPGSSFGHNEAWESLYLRVHTPNTAGGYVALTNHPATDLVQIGFIPSAGTHRGRVEKVGNAISFSVDANYNGVFSADMSHTFTDLAAVAPFLNSTNSHLFFGTVFPNDTFDNMKVVPEPGCAAMASLGLAILAAVRRRIA